MTLSLCIIVKRSQHDPFTVLKNQQIINLNSVNSMKLYDMLPDENIVNNSMQINNLLGNDNDDMDEDNIDNISCK